MSASASEQLKKARGQRKQTVAQAQVPAQAAEQATTSGQKLEMKPTNVQAAETAKSVAQQTVQGIEQYIGHTELDVLNGVRKAKHNITDLVSDAIAEELHPARIQGELVTAVVGKLQGLEASSAKGFEWGLPVGCSSPELQLSSLPVLDISHLFPASAKTDKRQLQSS